MLVVMTEAKETQSQFYPKNKIVKSREHASRAWKRKAITLSIHFSALIFLYLLCKFLMSCRRIRHHSSPFLAEEPIIRNFRNRHLKPLRTATDIFLSPQASRLSSFFIFFSILLPMPEDNSKPPDRRSGPSFSLPAWLDHFNARDMKNLFRSWLATWVATILMYIQPSLNSIGLATFFAPLVLYLIPPVGVASAYLMNSFFLLLGMCLAWTWGVITMKAAYAARPSSQTQALVQQLNEQAMLASQKSGESVSWESQRLVREGFMLDARVVVVFYVMSCIYIYTMARVRVANPKFAPGVTFGNIVLDIFLLYGPTLPSFTGELGRVLVLPGAIGIGLGLVCCLLFFPQSTSYSVLAQIGGIVMTCHKSLQYTRDRLAGKPVSFAELQSAKAKMTSSFQAMQTMLSFLPIDMSRCRWSTEDINSLEIPLHKLILVHLILFDYHITRARSVEQNIIDDQSEKVPSADELYQAGPGLALVLDIPELGSIRAQTRQSIKDSTDRLLDLYSDCLCLIAETLQSINNNRWMPSTSAEQPEQIAARGEQLLTQLRRCREETVSKTVNSLIQCHADIFTEDGLLMSPEFLHFQSLRSLALGLVLEEHILQCVIAGEKLLTHVLQLSNDRTVKRIWLPNGPKYALSWLCNGFRESPLFLSLSRADRDPEIAERDIEMAHQEPGPKNAYKGPSQLGFYARIIHDTYHWLTNDAGVYALRMVVVTIATAIPASLPHTAGFFYREKGLWGVITAQLCVLVYMADCIFSLSGRVVGTVAGGLLGLVAWYIGSGSGPGNPYGLSVITAVMTLVIVWSRIFFPHELTGMTVMSGVTFVLVMGFSYDATHLQDYGFPGYGYEAFYKRVITVLLGIMAAFIVQILPRPPSARLHIRKS
jgi:hypothetical protein